MALTYVALASVTVGSGGAASMDFTSIPGTYTDLLLKISGRTTVSDVAQVMQVKINDSTASIYSSNRLRGDGSSVAVGSTTNGSAIYNGYNTGSTATANTFGNTEIYFPNYASANNKSFSADGVSENNATTSYQQLIALLWASTSAITKIQIIPETGNFVQYSTATLYGIKNTV
jgi:hypothetical protein